ncbi:unnamed protein product, partial [Scytosiphon promiscuus]
RSTSGGLQRDVDEVVNMVCRLHRRLSDAACWTRHLQEDTRASRQKVARLVAQVRQLSNVKELANTDIVEQGPIAFSGGKYDGADDVAESSEAAFHSSCQDEVEHDAGYVDCGSAVRSRGFSGRSDETGGRLAYHHASPLNSRRSRRSRLSSRSSSPAVSARSFRSNSPTSRPGSPMSQGSGCGSMAPMYSPVALKEADCLANAASTDGVDCELDRRVGGGASLGGAAEAIEGTCRIQDVRGGCGGLVNQREELAASSDEGVDATNGRAAANDNDGDTKARSDLVASQRQVRLAAKDAPGGGNINTGSLPETYTAEATQQRLDTGNVSKRRGGARSRSRSPRRRKKALVDATGGTKEGRNNVTVSRTTSRSPADGNNLSSSSQCSGWGREGEMAGSSPRSDQGNSRESHRRRRRGKGKRRDSGNSARINSDSKVNPAPPAGSNAASEGGTGDFRGLDRRPRVTGTQVDRGAQQQSGGARVVMAEEQAGPDLMEAGHMLQALWVLLTTLRRLKYEGVDALGAVVQDEALLAAAGESNGVREAKVTASAPCESCLLLAEKLEDLRERDRLQQRLLERSDKLLKVATEKTTRAHDIQLSLAGQYDTSKISSSTIGSSTENARRPEVRNEPAIRGEDEGPRGDGQQAGRIGKQNSRESVEGDPSPRAAEAALAEVTAKATDEENEALLAAAEEVWRTSEMARDVLAGELERKDEALSTAAKSVKESKERLAYQAEETSKLKAALQTQEVETEKWKREAEKSTAKERDARRAMESAKVAAVDVLRRSEREGKTLRAEADSLKETVAALRTRLAGMQARRQAERELAAKKIGEVCEFGALHFVHNTENNSWSERSRGCHSHNPTRFPTQMQPSAFRHPNRGNDHDGSTSGRTSSRRYSSAPRGSGETSLTSIRETGRRRRTHSTYGAADADTLLHEYDDGGRCNEAFESLSEEALEEARGFPWSPGRQAVSGQDGEWRAGTESTITVNDVPSRVRAGAGVGAARRLSVTLSGVSPSRRMSTSMSTARGVTFSRVGKRDDSSHEDSGRYPQTTRPSTTEGRQDVRRESRSSSRRSSSAISMREGLGGTPVRKRVSSAVGTRERGASTGLAPVGGQRLRRIEAPMYTERAAQAARRQDIERVLRRASQSHPPPAPQQRNGSNAGSPGSTESAASNMYKGDESESINDAEAQGRKHEKGPANSAASGGIFEGGGGNEGDPFETAGEVKTGINADVPTDQADAHSGDDDWNKRMSSSENVHECPGDYGRSDDGGAEARGTGGLEPGRGRSSHGSCDREVSKQTIHGNIPGWNREQARPQRASSTPQKEDTASTCTSEIEEQVRQEQREKSASPMPLYRSPSPEFWESVEEAGLSTAELERVIEDLTEEEAERLLRKK